MTFTVPGHGLLGGRTTTEVVALAVSALTKLGPERVEQATVALSDPTRFPGWRGCFLARAYGEPGELHRLILDETRPDLCGLQRAARALGLTDDESAAIIWLFDCHRPVLTALVDEYQLEYRQRTTTPARALPRAAELLGAGV